jgi:ribonucleoside-diphosphate reductase beta chain
VDWIFEAGELDFLSAHTIKHFIMNRFNNSLAAIGLEKIFEVDVKELEKTDWFDDEVIATKQIDFFNKRSINYNKRSTSITSGDLF